MLEDLAIGLLIALILLIVFVPDGEYKEEDDE